ncbi:hypothetical protein ABGB19_20850 [Mycobacterium sp. B14F4]|uniref:hypothetical protein n=1 Tax=Mycobacterium sp. B14F4 TaxID=3153565 RepID=UPI00325DB499
MSRNMSTVIGAPFFVVGAIGMAVWLWVKRKQLVVAAAKAVPGQASAAARDEVSGVANAVPEQSSTVVDAIPKQSPSEH